MVKSPRTMSKLMRAFPTRSVAVGLLVCTACTAVRPVSRDIVTADSPPVIWIERNPPSQSAIVVTDPRVIGRDTLAGFVNGQYMELPFNQIGQIRARRPAPVRTLAFSAAIGLAVVGLGLLIKSGNGPLYQYEEPDVRPRR